MPRTSPGRRIAIAAAAAILALHLPGGRTAPTTAAEPRFRVLAFYTGVHDPAHASFAREANRWFPDVARRRGFTYEATADWSRLRTVTASDYEVLVFLDSRPPGSAERDAFRSYMEHGGAWLGFHFAAFALTPSDYPEDWPWYHDEFLGSGAYAGNTWRPTAAVLRVDAPGHPVTRGLPRRFRSAPNEWYRWQRDLRTNAAIEVLLSIDPSSFPLGTGPKPHEIWHSGDYPVAWTNRHYRMVYLNVGHNDIDYEHEGHRELSSTFAERAECDAIVNAILWLGGR